MKLYTVVRLMSGVLAASMAFAIVFTRVNDNAVFELDGDAAVNRGGGGHDWATINPPATPPAKGTLGFLTRSFSNDGTSGATIFTTGGSKDDLDITAWRHTNGAVPDKDDIVNAYAAAYNYNGDLVIYFGLDRFAQNGDANAGFWFNQAGGVIDSANAGRFTGTHRDHDILVLSTFTGGGSVSTVEVLEWNPTYCQGAGANTTECNVTSNKTLRRLYQSSAATCSATSHANVCGVANSAEIPVSWTYQAKAGNTPANRVPIAGFFEGGVNLSRILADAGVTQVPCITTFLAETRSSSSEDATLKDFAAGSFPVCGLEITKTCNTCTLANNGSAFRYSVAGTVTNTGFASIYNVVVTDGPLTFNLGTVAANATVNWGGGANDYVESTTQNPITNQATVNGSFDVAGTQPVPSVTSSLVTCATCTLNTGLLLSKTCTTAPLVSGGAVVISVNFSGSVQNTGNVRLNNVTVSEDHNADGSIDVTSLSLTKTVNGQPTACGSPCFLLPGETASFSGSYLPNTFTTITPGRAQFSDTVRATGVTALPPTTNVNATPQTAQCAICPPGSAACPLTN